MSSNIMISLDKIWKRYFSNDIFHRSLREHIAGIFLRKKKGGNRPFWALQGVSFQVKCGECVGLYGSNGAGKSTILKLIANVTYPTKGKLTINGRVAPLIEVGAGFHPDLTGRENIYMNGTIIGMKLSEIKDKIDNIIEFSELADFINMPVKRYSSGMSLRLAFATAIHSSAQIMLIDEILSVGDENFQKKVIEQIRNLAKSRAIIMVSHDKAILKAVTDQVVLLEKGRILDIVSTSSWN